MIEYLIKYDHPHRHFVSFEGTFPTENKDHIRLQLPAWRPGRYELGNFAKNIRHWRAYDVDGNLLSYKKITKDCWEIETKGSTSVRVSYQYYAAELNAGSTFLDEQMLYINPVNCFFYQEGSESLPYQLRFVLPESYEIACGLKQTSKHELQADHFDQLADAPLIASANLRHLQYQSNGVVFHIWIQGDLAITDTKLCDDFQKFTDIHFEIFGGIPCSEYHFLFHLPPYFIRHGVEHHNSTVIAMGPATEMSSPSGYEDFLAISCHELFHTWNIKSIRPVEMMPYDFTKENYSPLGYVAEGVTTYYGDYLLYRSGLISEQRWQEMLAEWIKEHKENQGRFNLSVAESSIDTWLDGYTPGIPWRKVSIYTEGALLAFITDQRIRQATSNLKSLDDVMRKMYERFGMQQKGYSERDYQNLLEELSGSDFSDIFNHLIHTPNDYTSYVLRALEYCDYELISAPAKYGEMWIGMKVEESNGKVIVNYIKENGPADHAGLWMGDEILSVNGIQPYKNFQNLLAQSTDSISLVFLRKNQIKKTTVTPSNVAQITNYFVAKKSSTTSRTEG